jgi:hypothetical protein
VAARQPADRKWACLVISLGPLVAAAGGVGIVYICAVGGMPYHRLLGWGYWHNLLRDLCWSPAVVPFLFCVILVAGGVGVTAAYLPVAFGWSTQPASSRAVTAVCLGVLLLGLCGVGFMLAG